VFRHAEDVDLFLLGVPIAPDTLEASRTVVQSVGHYADLGFTEGNEPPPEESDWLHQADPPGRDEFRAIIALDRRKAKTTLPKPGNVRPIPKPWLQPETHFGRLANRCPSGL
jgi:hypothetical protein